jgi:hypothetical protein
LLAGAGTSFNFHFNDCLHPLPYVKAIRQAKALYPNQGQGFLTEL